MRYLPSVLAIGIGLSVTNTAAVLGGLVRRGGVFQRTPKLRAEGRRQMAATSGYRTARHGSSIVEIVLAGYFALAIVIAVRLDMWGSLPFLLLFLHGYGAFAWLAIGRRAARTSAGAKTAPDAARAERAA